ncbi:MAG: hypothetical protein ACPGUV_11725, partial [Polyangiales bacterium]
MAEPEGTQSQSFAVLEDAKRALRQSPDHLPARIEALIEGADPEAMYRFVRDEIAVYPAARDAIGDSHMSLWGLRGVMRGGAGTVREKAELLAHMLQRAGFEAEVVAGMLEAPVAPAELVAAVLQARPVREFRPAVQDSAFAALRDSGHAEPSAPLVDWPVDVARGAGKAAELCAALRAQGRNDCDAVEDFRWDAWTHVPLVRLRMMGEEVYANPNIPRPWGVFGESFTRGTPTSARPMRDTADVTVRVLGQRLSGDEVSLVEGTWPVERLVGRQLHLSFATHRDLAGTLQQKVMDADVFLPALILQDPHMSDAEVLQASVFA